MKFSIVMGIPEMLAYWESLSTSVEKGTAKKEDVKIHKLLRKTFLQISTNPKYPGLHTHEIDALTFRYGVKVFQSYCEKRNPRAMRVYWVYGPVKDYITIIGVEPHPNDAKSNAYSKIRLSGMGDAER